MGLQFRKRKRLDKDSWVNYSGSGASVSRRFGPVTVNSRGGFSVRLGPGLNFRGRWR
ncbi:DUF4236 domain-containing protein [Corynebacterium sphenisci]|uniref:DUF4236 domain-containing protein n=1 Tax=Corynebacterium sphenisci TaxID=191493 RepID=UPI0012F48642|nr:DUF4236 domain-containing protein [Corynebacterium sphenisci]